MTNLYYQVLPSGRLSFSISTMTSFHLAEASLFRFWRLYTLMCAVVQKYYEMSFIHNYSHFQYSFCNQPVLFEQLENVNKLQNSNHTVHMNKRNQNKNKTKHVIFKFTMHFIVRFSLKTMQWYHLRMTSLSDVRAKRKISCQ